MKSLHLINVRWYNATAWYAVNLARVSRGNGDTAYICGCPDTPPVLKAAEYGLPAVSERYNSSNPFVLAGVIVRTMKLLKQEQFDVVACHRSEFFWFFALLKRLTRPRWKLVRVRGDVRKPKSDPVTRFLLKGCDAVVTTGEFMRQEYITRLGLSAEQVHVVPGGVDTSFFQRDDAGRERVRREFGCTAEHLVLGIVGRFDPVKGHDVLFRAVAKLKSAGVPVRCLVVGFDAVTTTADIEKLMSDAGVADDCVITGKRDDIVAVMSALDVGVVSSLGSEAICRVAMELMSCGVPVVASDVGVLPEVVPSENIYPRHDADALAEKILHRSAECRIYSDEAFYTSFHSFL